MMDNHRGHDVKSSMNQEDSGHVSETSQICRNPQFNTGSNQLLFIIIEYIGRKPLKNDSGDFLGHF